MTAREDYEALTRAYETAVREGDAEGLADLFAEDAMFFAPDQPALVGRAAIRRDYASGVGEGFPVAITVLDVQDGGDILYASGEVDFGEGAKKWLQVAKRQPDGALRIHRLAWN